MDRGITVTSSPDALSEHVANSALMLILMMARRGSNAAPAIPSAQKSGRPATGQTLGLVGFGRIGRAVAKRAHHGFRMRVLVYDPSPVDPGVAAAFGVEQVASIDEMLPHADFVSLHCTGGADNYHLFNAHRLNLMKPEAFLINTAHGEVVDEQALVHALWFETIGGAGIGVCPSELRRLPELRACDNAIVLPHHSDAELQTREAAGFRMADNVLDFVEGRSPRDRV